jgi:putative peptidoglycan lipid II flippase
LVAVLVATLGGALVLVAVAAPAARVLVAGAPGPENVDALARATAAFAPGLVGYGLLALLGRALYARGDGRTPAVATVAGWLVVAVTDVVLVAARPSLDRVVALGIGNTVGMTLAAVLLVAGVRRVAPSALDGAGRALGAGLLGCLVGGAAVFVLPSFGDSVAASAVACVVLAVVAAGVYLGVVRLLQPDALRELLRA